MYELIKVLVYEHLHLCNLLLQSATFIVRCPDISREQVNFILLEELLHKHVLKVALMPLGVEATHFGLILLLIKLLPQIQCLLGHFFKKWLKKT